MGAEGVHGGRITAGEDQRRRGDHARRRGGARHTPTATTSPSRLRPVPVQMVHAHHGEAMPGTRVRAGATPSLLTPFYLLPFDLQGRFDALLALLRRQYDRVAIMRPTSQDKVGNHDRNDDKRNKIGRSRLTNMTSKPG